MLFEGFSEKAWTLCGFQAGVGADCRGNPGLSGDHGWGGEAGVVAEGPHSSDSQGQKAILACFRNEAKSHLRAMVRTEGPTYDNGRASEPAGRGLRKVEGATGFVCPREVALRKVAIVFCPQWRTDGAFPFHLLLGARDPVLSGRKQEGVDMTGKNDREE